MRLKFIICQVLQREAYHCAAESENIVDIFVLPQGLHNTPDKLRQSVQQQLDDTVDIQGRKYDAAVLGYCLCCNGIAGLKAQIPIVAARGHDCMTLLLGSKEKYKEYFDSHRGIYWYSCGWIEHNDQPSKERYEKTLAQYTEKYGKDNAEYLMQTEQNWLKEYQWATFVETVAPDSEKYKKYTKQCAEFLNWKYDQIKGDLSLMKKLLSGSWNQKDFLIVQPGQTIAADLTDPDILKAE